MTRGVLCVWRTRVRFDDGDCGGVRELITPLHVSRVSLVSQVSHGRERCEGRPVEERWTVGSDVNDLMRGAVNRLARSAIDVWIADEDAWRTRAGARDLAIVRALRARAGAHAGVGGRAGAAAAGAGAGAGAGLDEGAGELQPLLFRDIDADREARLMPRARPHFPTSESAYVGMTTAAASAATAVSAAFEHSLVLMLVIQ
jgi:hypothetical protein